MDPVIVESESSTSNDASHNPFIKEELKRLHKMIDSGEFNPNEQETNGCEAEINIVDGQTGGPLALNEQIVPKVAGSQTEVVKYALELNGAVEIAGPGALIKIETDLQTRLQRCIEVAKQLNPNAEILAHGIAFNVGDEHFTREWVSSKPRYHELDRNLIAYGGEIDLDLAGAGARYSRRLDNITPLGVTMSFQPHFKMALQRFPGFYNWLLAISGPLGWISRNSPLAFGTVAEPETRFRIWEQVIRYARFGVGFYLNEDDPFAVHTYFQVAAEGPEFLKLPGRTGEESPWALPNLAMLNSYRWRTSSRPVLGFTPNQGPHVRAEVRQLAMAPPPDCALNMAIIIGLVHGSLQTFGRASEVCTYEQAEEGAKDVMTDWNGTFHWNGRRWSGRLWWETVGLELMAKGLAAYGFSDSEAQRYLDGVVLRLQNGTPADIIRGFWERCDGSQEDRIRETIAFIVRNQTHPTALWS